MSGGPTNSPIAYASYQWGSLQVVAGVLSFMTWLCTCLVVGSCSRVGVAALAFALCRCLSVETVGVHATGSHWLSGSVLLAWLACAPVGSWRFVGKHLGLTDGPMHVHTCHGLVASWVGLSGVPFRFKSSYVHRPHTSILYLSPAQGTTFTPIFSEFAIARCTVDSNTKS